MIVIVDMNGKKNSLGWFEFVYPLVRIVGDCEVRHFSEMEEEDCEKAILSGACLKDTAYLREPEKFEWMREVAVPVLGIGAGMQAIALVFGSRLRECCEIGMRHVDVVRENPLVSASFEAYELHHFAVEPSEDFEVIARSDACVQAIAHKKKAIYGVLFHPEVRNRNVVNQFMLM